MECCCTDAICYRTEIKGIDLTHLGQTAIFLKKTLEKMAVMPSIIRRVAVTAYEAEMNIAVHAEEGVLIATVNNDCVEIMAEDKGPGIPDLGQAMRAGYSTAPGDLLSLGFGAGMGLPNIKNNADVLEIDSAADRGTKLRVKVFL